MGGPEAWRSKHNRRTHTDVFYRVSPHANRNSLRQDWLASWWPNTTAARNEAEGFFIGRNLRGTSVFFIIRRLDLGFFPVSLRVEFRLFYFSFTVSLFLSLSLEFRFRLGLLWLYICFFISSFHAFDQQSSLV